MFAYFVVVLVSCQSILVYECRALRAFKFIIRVLCGECIRTGTNNDTCQMSSVECARCAYTTWGRAQHSTAPARDGQPFFIDTHPPRMVEQCRLCSHMLNECTRSMFAVPSLANLKFKFVQFNDVGHCGATMFTRAWCYENQSCQISCRARPSVLHNRATR